jgi:hypothetical protein
MQSAQWVGSVHGYEARRDPVAHGFRRASAAGVVFVPCGVCLVPVDLASVGASGKPPRCERHAAVEGLHLS